MTELDAHRLAACRRGDVTAFEALVHLYQDRVYALCTALAPGDAEDLAQETFMRVYTHIGRFDPAGPARLGTWILTIARRLCHDRARAARLRVEIRSASPPERAGEQDSPEERVASARAAGQVRRAIARLPEEQRAVLALREWDGLEYEEIARVEGVPVGTVKSRLARAKEALRTLLAEENGNVDRAAGS